MNKMIPNKEKLPVLSKGLRIKYVDKLYISSVNDWEF